MHCCATGQFHHTASSKAHSCPMEARAQKTSDSNSSLAAVTELPQMKTRRSFPFVAASSRSARRRPPSQNRLDDKPQNRVWNSCHLTIHREGERRQIDRLIANAGFAGFRANVGNRFAFARGCHGTPRGTSWVGLAEWGAWGKCADVSPGTGFSLPARGIEPATNPGIPDTGQ